MSRPRQGHTALLLDEEVTSGYLRITSDMGVLASESFSVEKSGAPTSVGAIDMAKYKDVTSVYSPRFVLDDERTTILNVINGNENAADITIELYGDNGVLIASRTHNIAGNAQIKGTLANVLDNNDLSNYGWIKVSSTEDQIVGIVTFRSPANRYLGSFELLGTPLKKFIFPLVTENSDFVTEFSFLNTGTGNVSLRLELWDENGGDAPVAMAEASLAEGESLSRTLLDFFGTTKDSGNVRVLSDKPIYGTAEIQAKSKRFITPVPATAY